jgi:hypothetical protein
LFVEPAAIRRPAATSVFATIGVAIHDSFRDAEAYWERAIRGGDSGIYLSSAYLRAMEQFAGGHGFYFRDEVPQRARDRALAEALRRISESEDAPACLVKDFGSQDLPRGLGHSACFTVDKPPNMVIGVPPTWKTFDDYIAALSTQYRHRAKSAIKKGAPLSRVELGFPEILEHAPRLEEMQATVHSHAGFSLGRMDVRRLAAIKRALGDRFVVTGYFLKGILVGYFAAVAAEGRIDAYCVGFDGSCNREFAIYPNMLYDHVRLAIERCVCRISLGRTAEEMKSALGAAYCGEDAVYEKLIDEPAAK